MHLLKFVKGVPGLEEVDGRATLLSIQLASLVARVVCGKAADYGCLRRNRVLLQQAAFVAMGVLTMLLNFTSRLGGRTKSVIHVLGTIMYGVFAQYCFFLLFLSWGTMIAFCLALGLADGCFWCAEAPIAYDLVYIYSVQRFPKT